MLYETHRCSARTVRSGRILWLPATRARARVVGWNFTGVLSIGRGSTGQSFNGNIDELKTLQGIYR